MSETESPSTTESSASPPPPVPTVGEDVGDSSARARTAAPVGDGPVVVSPGVTIEPSDPALGTTTGSPAVAAAVPAPKLTRRGRLRKWDRPPPPHDWRWYVGNLGKTLITLGLLMFGFVAYQLWGTGIETARAQNALENEFEELLATTGPVEIDFAPVESQPVDPDAVAGSDTDVETDLEPADADDSDPLGSDPDPLVETDPETAPIEPASVPVVPVEDQNLPLVENGDAIARIEIPRIGVNDIVVAGVETGDLKKGPGHFPDTPLPGQLGNAAIAGHRTTYGQPFHNVDKLEVGDEIRMTTLNGVYVYKVTGQQIVSPADYQVVATTDPTVANLTLTSCHPKWTARERIVIFSELDRTESAAVGEPVLNYGRPAEPSPTADPSSADPDGSGDPVASEGATDPVDGTSGTVTDDGGVSGSLAQPDEPDTELLGSATTNEGIADAFSESWFSDPAANPHVGFWGAVLALIGIGAYLLSRRLRRDWVGALVGVLPFVVALYFFFQNVNRLLPPNL